MVFKNSAELNEADLGRSGKVQGYRCIDTACGGCVNYVQLGIKSANAGRKR